MLIIDILVTDILNDDYFLDIFEKCKIKSSANNFQNQISLELTRKEFIDSLKFADILSNSNNSIARNKAYQIITSLNSYYKNELHRRYCFINVILTISKDKISRFTN